MQKIETCTYKQYYPYHLIYLMNSLPIDEIEYSIQDPITFVTFLDPWIIDCDSDSDSGSGCF